MRRLLELAFSAEERGLLAMDEMVRDQKQYPDAFLRKAVELTVEISDPDRICKVLYNLLITTKYIANYHFLKDVLITETMLAVSQSEDLDYIFTHLIPSYFGMEFEGRVTEEYKKFRQARLKAGNQPV